VVAEAAAKQPVPAEAHGLGNGGGKARPAAAERLHRPTRSPPSRTIHPSGCLLACPSIALFCSSTTPEKSKVNCRNSHRLDRSGHFTTASAISKGAPSRSRSVLQPHAPSKHPARWDVAQAFGGRLWPAIGCLGAVPWGGLDCRGPIQRHH
jgi:hypothetical protein